MVTTREKPVAITQKKIIKKLKHADTKTYKKESRIRNREQ